MSTRTFTQAYVDYFAIATVNTVVKKYGSFAL